MTYEVRLSRRALRYLQRLGTQDQRRISKKIDEIIDAPTEPSVAKPLSGAEGLRSARVGGWRIIFSVDEGQKVIRIAQIGPRGQVYRTP